MYVRTNGTVGIKARGRARTQAQSPLSPLHTPLTSPSSLGATQAQQEMMWQPITLSWIWTHKTNTDQYVDWYIVNHDYREPQDGTDEWSVIPYSWLKPSQAAQYQKDFLPPARNVPPGTNYWKGFEIKTVCRDDISPLEKRFCNFGVAYSEVPNFTWTEGEKVGLWHLKNRHHDPEFKPPTIEFHPETNGAPEDPFSTFAAIPGSWAHYINAKAHSDRTIPDKNESVEFKIMHNIKKQYPLRCFVFFYTDPDQHEEYWNEEPTNPNIKSLDPNGDWTSEPDRKKGVGANDNKKVAGGFFISIFDRPGLKELKPFPDELPSGSSLYFTTNHNGGDNFIPKAYFITPACFQWGRLGKPDTDESVTVWRKYPVTVGLVHNTIIPQMYQNLPPGSITPAVNNFNKEPVKTWVKGAYDDGFAYVYPYDELNRKTNTVSYNSINIDELIQIHRDLEFPEHSLSNDICHNPLLLIFDCALFDYTIRNIQLGGSDLSGLGTSFCQYPIAAYSQYAANSFAGYTNPVTGFTYKGTNDTYNAWFIIHELEGHVVSHFGDQGETKANPAPLLEESAMYYFSYPNYTWDTQLLSSGHPVLTFTTDRLEVIRKGELLPLIKPEKWIGFFNRRRTPNEGKY